MQRLFLFALLGAAATAAANPVVFPRFESSYLSQDLPEEGSLLFVGDVNHDGRLDAVTVGGRGDARTLFGAQDGSFVVGPLVPHQNPTYYVPQFGALLDFDGDGELDLAVNYGDDLVLLRGDGSGHFTDLRGILSSPMNRAVFGEFTGDGLVDVALVRSVVDRRFDLFLYKGTPTGAFEQVQVFPGTVSPPSELYGQNLLARDLDGDGHDEVIWTGPSSLRVYGGQTSGGFTTVSVVGLPDAPDLIGAGDFDGDGKIDLTTQSRYQTGHWICRANGTAGFDPAVFEPTSVYRGSFQCGDFDGDGRDEILYAGTRMTIEPVDGILDSGTIPFRFIPTMWSAADVDKDGRVDFLALRNATLSILFSPPTGAGDNGVATAPAPVSVQLHDLDRDGNLDAITTHTASDQVSILWGDGAGGFPARTDLTVGDGVDAVAIGHLDADAWPDLVVSEPNAGTFGVIRGAGTRAFGPETSYPCGIHPRGLGIGDVTGDGIPDVVVAFDIANQVKIFPGDGAGNLVASTTIATGSAPCDPRIVDVDADGRLDLVYGLRIAGNLGIRLGHEGGALGPEQTAPAASKVSRFLPLDLDHDGQLDFASIGATPAVTVARNTGGGFFSWYGTFTPDASLDIATGDFDGDGVSEVAFLDVGVGINEITTPGNALASNVFYGSGLAPSSMASGDLNHDGRPDFVVVSKNNSLLSVILNRNSGPLVSVPPAPSMPSRLRFASRMPARGEFALAYDATSTDEGSLRVLSARGAVVFQARIVPNASGAQLLRVAPTGLRGGVYWAEVRQGSFRDVVKFVFIP